MGIIQKVGYKKGPKQYKGLAPLIEKLRIFSKNYIKRSEFHVPSELELDFYNTSNVSLASAMYVPHQDQYDKVLDLIEKEDVIIDMGAGDFRFALMASNKAKKVYALELNPMLVGNALEIIGYNMPKNLVIMCADWVHFPIPKDVNKIVCLCNGPKIPDEWLNFKLIIGETTGIITYGV